MKYFAACLFLFCLATVLEQLSNDASPIPYSAFIDKTLTPVATRELHYHQLRQFASGIADGKPVSVVWLGWSPDGQQLGVIYEDDHQLHILNANSGNVERIIQIPEATVLHGLDLAWSPDGKRLAGTFDITFGTTNGIIKIWNLSSDSEQPVVTINRPNDRTSGLSWSPDGTKLSSVHFSSKINSDVLSTWDARTGALLLTKDNVAIGAWSPDGKKMLIYTKTLQIVSPDTFQVLADFPGKETYNFSVYAAWTADSQTVVGEKCETSRGDLCHLWAWDIGSDNLFQNFDETGADPRGYVEASPIALSHSDELLSKTELQSNTLELWDMRTGAMFDPQISENGEITVFCWHPSKDIIAVGSTDGLVQILEIQN